MLKRETLDQANGLSTATAHEAAGRIGALPSMIKPTDSRMKLCGPAYPVRSPRGDNLFLHHAIYSARPGDVLVIDCQEAVEYGYWGEVMAVAALSVGLAGIVISGGVRDADRFIEVGLPVFAGNVCIRGTGKDPMGDGTLGAPIRIGEVDIFAGDLVIGDRDGVVVIPQTRADEVVALSRRRDSEEQVYFDRLRQGETTIDIYGLPALGAGRT